MRLGRHEREAGIPINPAGGDQNALGPQRDLAIAAGFCECDAFGDQPLAQSLSTSGRIDNEQADFRDIVAVSHQKDRADLRAIKLGDPAALARGVERGEELCGDFRDQALERGVEAVFGGVECAVALHHPSHVAGAGAAQDGCGRRCIRRAEQPFDLGHGADQPLAAACR
jgi:hypothetical protein